MLWVCQALSSPKQRYSWARGDGRRPLPGVRSAGHISKLCRGKRQYLCYTAVPSAGGVQIAGAQPMNVYMCTCTWSTCISGGNLKQFQRYVMSQHWLRTRAFLTMPVKGAPRIENLSQL